MLEIEITKKGRFEQTGSSLLSIMQSSGSMPLLDLVVREAIQNSLDAAKMGKEFVEVDFSVGDFRASDLNQYFQGISNTMNQLYPDNGYKYFSIRDKNTGGLTGKLHHSELVEGEGFGNLLKLVYEVSKKQETEGAGGSWGLGKTIYFRIGIGLVIYYSRIQEKNGRFSSRLAAVLVEDEKSNKILRQDGNDRRGIALWGRKYKDTTETIPITDESIIEKVLNVFGIPLYKGEETGTTIIIPYIDEKKLLHDTKIIGHQSFFWCDSVEEYLKVAIPKWYTLRLSNKAYKFGPWLKAKVNGEKIKKKDIPIFSILQDMYNSQPLCKSKEADLLKKHDYFNISINSVFKNGSHAGYLAHVRLKKDELGMVPGQNKPSPYAYISNYFEERTVNPPIVVFTRKPGMIVNYDLAKEWSSEGICTGEDEFIVAVFVLNSDNEIDKETGKETGKTFLNASVGKDLMLEEYVRQGERAEHSSWDDYTIPSQGNLNIIGRIKKNVKTHLQKEYKTKEQGTRIVHTSGVAKALADLLLPPENFGITPTFPQPDPHGTRTGTLTRKSKPSKVSALKLTKAPFFENHRVNLDFSLFWGENIKKLKIFLKIASDGNDITVEDWEGKAGVGTKVPFVLGEIKIEREKWHYSYQLLSKKASRLGEFTFKPAYTSTYESFYGVEIERDNSKWNECVGSISYTLKDPLIKLVLELEEVKEVK